MLQVEIVYPVIHFNSITVEMTNAQYEQLIDSSLEDQAKFIAKQNDEQSPGELTNPMLIEGALNMGYAYLKRL